MSFDSRFYVQADDEMNRIRQKNQQLHELRTAEIREKYPDISDVQYQLRLTLSKVLTLIAEKPSDISLKLGELEKENLSLQDKLRHSLIRHGYPADYLDPVYDCKLCCDTGVVNGKKCSCFMSYVRKAAAEDMNSHSPLKLCSFGEFSLQYYDDNTPTPLGTTARRIMEYNLNVCREYADNFHLPYNGLLMRGKTGLGKTHLSLSIAAQVMDKGYSVIYGSAPDLFRTIEREHFNRASEQTDTLENVIKTDLLVIDDLGAEFDNKSKFYAHLLYNIINDRLNASLPTIINTNLEHKELEERYEERTYSRLSTLTELFFTGSDVRVKKAALQQ